MAEAVGMQAEEPGLFTDLPYLDMAYKLVPYDGRPVMKLSTGTATLVGQKQVWRRTVDGYYSDDIIALRHEPAVPCRAARCIPSA